MSIDPQIVSGRIFTGNLLEKSTCSIQDAKTSICKIISDMEDVKYLLLSPATAETLRYFLSVMHVVLFRYLKQEDQTSSGPCKSNIFRPLAAGTVVDLMGSE